MIAIIDKTIVTVRGNIQPRIPPTANAVDVIVCLFMAFYNSHKMSKYLHPTIQQK